VEVAVGGRVTLVGVRIHVRPPKVGEMLAERVTVPAKPALEAIVTVELAAVPAFTVTLVGLALILKPGGGPIG
jgi:hypothetical protein